MIEEDILIGHWYIDKINRDKCEVIDKCKLVCNNEVYTGILINTEYKDDYEQIYYITSCFSIKDFIKHFEPLETIIEL